MTEPWFRKQFSGLSLVFPPNGSGIFKLTPPSPDKKPGELDAITGATQTSLAIQAFMNKGLRKFVTEKLKRLAGVTWKNG